MGSTAMDKKKDASSSSRKISSHKKLMLRVHIPEFWLFSLLQICEHVINWHVKVAVNGTLLIFSCKTLESVKEEASYLTMHWNGLIAIT
ncbi:hypothetical protein DUI87_17916 [Hirundo rustica rustica]|uniref:Uncharacterized protein n=1 Tax=Hirundo rustica rustica TaxID=333673 RepID=A0A3M0JVI3_HIRRU|nr:hypothetical protein DUI87_17916 [Hirundo rustica rustica]